MLTTWYFWKFSIPLYIHIYIYTYIYISCDLETIRIYVYLFHNDAKIHKAYAHGDADTLSTFNTYM